MLNNLRSTIVPALLVMAEALHTPHLSGQEPILSAPAVTPQVFWLEFPDGTFVRYEHSNTHPFQEGDVLTLVEGDAEKRGVVHLLQPAATFRGATPPAAPQPPADYPITSAPSTTLVLPPGSEALWRQTDQFSLAHARQVIRYSGPAEIQEEVLRVMNEAHAHLSDSWLGHRKPLPRITIQVQVVDAAPQGRASFSGIQTTHQSIDVVVRSRASDVTTVLWHEMNHVVFRLHFGNSLPRWIDEGCAMTVERQDQQDTLIQLLVTNYLRTNRGISFNQMLSQMDEPSPRIAGPFYGQSLTTISFLLDRHPDPEASLTDKRRYFVRFVEMVLQGGADLSAYDQALTKFYNLKNPSDLQNQWLDSLRKRYVRE